MIIILCATLILYLPTNQPAQCHRNPLTLFLLLHLQADDKSLLARFYHADHALTAVASELDSFDGRAEPERCSRLVGKLRTGQEQVLGITNLIMDELLSDERSSRAFRAKFPEEVLQESLAGQLWFGAECLAAGSSILNREQESAEMRPLAKAVTKSLDNVRNLLREQCLRNNTPNSPRLNLNLNDAATEQLCESLKIFDRLFAEFELRYVSAMVTVKTKQEHETQELICVLFSETVHRALKLNLLDQDQVDSFDPALMFSIPRLAIVAGLVVFKEGPLNMDVIDGQLSEMFRPFRTLLMKIRDLLRSLSKEQLRQLERLLCSNEDVTSSTYSQGSGSGKGAIGRSTKEASGEEQWPTTVVAVAASDNSNRKELEKEREARIFRVLESSSSSSSSSSSEEEEEDLHQQDEDEEEEEGQMLDRISNMLETIDIALDVSYPSPTAAESTADSSPTTTNNTARDDEGGDNEQIDVINDCASGYLIPNTNLGYLLQPSAEAPLTDSFISTEEDDDNNHHHHNLEGERNVTALTSDEDDHDEDEVDVDRSRCLLDHFIDTVSTKSSSSATDSTGTASSSNTTSTSGSSSTTAPTTTTTATTTTGERENRRSPSTSSASSSSSASSESIGDYNKSFANSTTTTTIKCLEETAVAAASAAGKEEEEARESANQDSGMCTETNSSDDRSPESESAATGVESGAAGRGTTKEGNEETAVEGHRVLSRRYASNWESLQSGCGDGGVEVLRNPQGQQERGVAEVVVDGVREKRRHQKETPSGSGGGGGGGSSRRRRDGGGERSTRRRHHHHHHSSSRSYLRRCVAYPSTSSGGGGAGGSSRRISHEEVDMVLGGSGGTSSVFEDDHVGPEIADAIMDATK